MSFEVDTIINENWKSESTLGEIFCVVPELYRYVPIDKIGFSNRVNSALLRHGNNFTVKSLSELFVVTISDLYSIRNLGVGGIKEILKVTNDFLENYKPELIPDEENPKSIFNAIDKSGNSIIDTQGILGANVRNIRESRNLSQSDFAERCDIPLMTLRSIENNISNPTLSILKRIARYANCMVSQLLEENLGE